MGWNIYDYNHCAGRAIGLFDYKLCQINAGWNQSVEEMIK